MARRYKVTESTASLLDAMRHLYEFYDEFHGKAEALNTGQKLLDDVEQKWQALQDSALLLVGYKMTGDLESYYQDEPEI